MCLSLYNTKLDTHYTPALLSPYPQIQLPRAARAWQRPTRVRLPSGVPVAVLPLNLLQVESTRTLVWHAPWPRRPSTHERFRFRAGAVTADLLLYLTILDHELTLLELDLTLLDLPPLGLLAPTLLALALSRQPPLGLASIGRGTLWRQSVRQLALLKGSGSGGMPSFCCSLQPCNSQSIEGQNIANVQPSRAALSLSLSLLYYY